MKLVACAKPQNAVKAEESELILRSGGTAQGYYVGDERYERVSRPNIGVRWYHLEQEAI